MVEADRRVTIDEIIIRLPPGIEIRRSSIGTIMSDVLDFRKVCARWVARLLLENHKQQRMEAARVFLEMHQRDGEQLFSRIVTGDESWVHHSTPETKRQSMVWKKPEESAPKKAKVTISAGKVMAMENFKWKIFTHPPHSPELAPSDFHLYPALKWHLGGKHFANDDEVQAEANHWLRRQDTTWKTYLLDAPRSSDAKAVAPSAVECEQQASNFSSIEDTMSLLRSDGSISRSSLRISDRISVSYERNSRYEFGCFSSFIFITMDRKKVCKKSSAKKKMMSIELKREIIEKHEQGVRVVDLSRQYGRSTSMICSVLKRKESIKSVTPAKGLTIISKLLTSLHENMEKLLMVWVTEKQLQGDTLTQTIICEKARAIYGDLLKQTPQTSIDEASEESFKASRAWFENFKKRSGIHSVVRHGEQVPKNGIRVGGRSESGHICGEWKTRRVTSRSVDDPARQYQDHGIGAAYKVV
ncbi:hypothetical protein LAZ67_8000400 [Cordylochernes scorpioides]|uniref:HTH CENPB-type domain-containing protein n=1 Tax=Cordylochernes scorpioides TaxID=51811 RepID=A0ABY6KR03_9ARAC|nr:hypothetical protein LAZ67_8000400 [Cordylochernes scorpioides]